MIEDQATAPPDSNPGASQDAIRHHYDVGNDFFELWLDRALTYSCALFLEGDDLDAAQIRKVTHHLTEARALGVGRLLDVGCGWGALIGPAVRDHGVGAAVGLTLSNAQREYITKRYIEGEGISGLDVRVESWSDHEPEQPYDAIISVGAFEHFAKPDMTRDERVAGYASFFHRCHDWLRPGRAMSLQTIVWEKMARAEGNRFLMDEVYPETDLPTLSEICDAVGGKFEIIRLTTDRMGYVRTLNEWRQRLRRHRDQAIALVGPEIYERYLRYVSLCAVAFHQANLSLARFSLRRLD
jgi:cyclopropane-fatty-acyl-phospholipid synthase